MGRSFRKKYAEFVRTLIEARAAPDEADVDARSSKVYDTRGSKTSGRRVSVGVDTPDDVTFGSVRSTVGGLIDHS